jgi:hypothetical protein
LARTVFFAAVQKMTQPAFFESLGASDQLAYNRLRALCSSSSFKNRRNHSLVAFESMLDCIRSFVVGTDEDQQKRARVCGICWFDNSIAVNINQFRILTKKGKSTINGLFQSLKYGLVRLGSDAGSAL